MINNLSMLYQVPQSNYLAMLEQVGCESIGALTFISNNADANDYQPTYEPPSDNALLALTSDSVCAATTAEADTRLSLAGAQSKVDWYLSPNFSENSSCSNSPISNRLYNRYAV